MDDDRDFVTVNPTVGYKKFNVVVMRYDHHEQSHVVSRISQALPKVAAESLAKSWAAVCQLDIR